MAVTMSPDASSQGSTYSDSEEKPLIPSSSSYDNTARSRSNSLESVTTPRLRRHITRFLLVILGLVVLVVGGFGSSAAVQGSAVSRQGLFDYAKGWYRNGSPYYEPSVNKLPPRLNDLPSSLQRVTLISIWSSDNRAFYLNNFFRSAALNSDVADLLVIHVTNDPAQCLDGTGKKDSIYRDKAWDWENGGNIRVVCMSKEALMAHEADYLCSEAGWNCSEEQHKAVSLRLHDRPDVVNSDWKALRGEMFKQYFIHPSNPLWAWSDMDEHLGRLDHIPFSLLSTVSIMTPATFTPSLLFLAGQMTFFNMASPGLVGAWKEYTPLSSPEAFCKPLTAAEGGYAEGGSDESWLSAAYLRQEPGYAGRNLSWAIIPDVHGQDVFIPGRKFVVSGRNVLEVDSALTRQEIEAVLEDASAEAVDQYAGWTERGTSKEVTMLTGEACPEAWFDKRAAQCVVKDSLTVGDQFREIDSVRRGTLLRLASDPVNQLQLRLEPDHRPRRWQRKLFLHYQEIKRQTWWWGLPEYFIGDNDEVMEFDWKSQYVWRKGADREKNLWEKHNDRLNDDGTSAHTHPLETDPQARMVRRIRRSLPRH